MRTADESEADKDYRDLQTEVEEVVDGAAAGVDHHAGARAPLLGLDRPSLCRSIIRWVPTGPEPECTHLSGKVQSPHSSEHTRSSHPK